MSTDDRQGDQPEFPMRDADGNPIAQTPAAATPPLPDIPAWQAPVDDSTGRPESVSADRATGSGSDRPEVVEEFEVVEVVETDADASARESAARETAAREPLGGPYVVTEHGAPVAEQATAAYERQPIGGPYVTSSEPTPSANENLTESTPYPAAAFAPAPAPAAGAAPAAVVGSAAYAYQPVPQPLAAPVPPDAKGNRGGGSLIALIGTLAFAIVYAGVSFLIIAANVGATDYIPAFSSFLLSAAFIVPVVVFAISLILIVLIVNRAGWWAYVLGGFLVAVLVYVAGIAGALIHVQAWNFQPQEQYDFVRSLTMDPLTLAGAIVAREVSIWTGAWIAARGRRVKARNIAAREEYERNQEAALAVPTTAAPASAGHTETQVPGTTW
ncbi:hypothetical protein [Herbiconiux daphne]|uniref:ABC transporter n=1 Tax=Herbiconiux daphne TaxID=2970914 RepID=A0ABT2GX71_9MICO|nr:hypothetical protein [Herbiconiux daphne]MCS5732557.1 hypothetical protein [Herbiconiux daphne]